MMDETIVDLVFEAAWKSLLVSGAALLLLALLKGRSAAERACVANFGMAAVLLVPLLVVLGPSLEVELLAGAPLPQVADSAAPIALAPAALQTSVSAEPAGPWIDGETATLLAYGVPAALLLLVTLIAILRLFALRSRSSVIVQQGWLTALAHAQRRMGIKHGTALLASSELRSPVSWGIMRPIILLSEDDLDKPLDAEAIIAHELAHVARADWFNLLAARIATALFWFNPLVWLLARQGQQLREEAADDAVLRADVPCTDYAALLVGAARHEGRSMLLAANGVAPGKGSLSQRVRRILEPTLRRGPARMRWGTGCAAGALLIAGPLAALTPVAPAAPEAPVEVAALPAPPTTPTPPAAVPSPVAAVAGVTPSTAPIAAALAAGVVGAAPTAPAAAPAAAAPPAPPAPPIPPETLVAMRTHGVDAATHAEFVAANPRLRNASFDQLVALRVHRVTPAQMREYAALGYSNLNADRLVEWAVHGVTPDYIRSVATEGYQGLSASKLTEFRVMGVSPGFIREVKQAGLELSPNRLVEARIHGIATARPPRPRAGPASRLGPAPSG